MNDSDLITDVRLIALETILQKLLASQLAQYTPAESQRIKREMNESSSKFDAFFPEGPTAVDTRKLALLENHVNWFFDVVEQREIDVRERQDLPPLHQS